MTDRMQLHLGAVKTLHWLTSVRTIIVCGGRNFFPEPPHETALRDVLRAYAPTVMFHGAASGADRWAGIVARDMSIRVREFPAPWDLYGKSAGPIRNEEMAIAAEFGVCVAFSGGKGTNGMVELAREHRMYVVDLREMVG